MKHTLKVDQVRDGLWLDSDITYTQVPGWLGNTTRDLKLSVIRHFQTKLVDHQCQLDQFELHSKYQYPYNYPLRIVATY